MLYKSVPTAFEQAWKDVLQNSEVAPKLFHAFASNIQSKEECALKATFTQKQAMKVKPATDGPLEVLLDKIGWDAISKSSTCRSISVWQVVGSSFRPSGMALINTNALHVGKGPQVIIEKGTPSAS